MVIRRYREEPIDNSNYSSIFYESYCIKYIQQYKFYRQLMSTCHMELYSADPENSWIEKRDLVIPSSLELGISLDRNCAAAIDRPNFFFVELCIAEWQAACYFRIGWVIFFRGRVADSEMSSAVWFAPPDLF